MVSIDEATVARLKTHGERFEILVDPDEALKFKKGEEYENFLVTNYIFTDAEKAKKAPQDLLQNIFSTTEVNEVAKKIVKKGELLYTAEQRKKMREDKRKDVISRLSQGIDPRTGRPHPPKRIENALKKANIHIDPSKSAEKQVKEILKEIRPIIPIKFEEREIAVGIPAQYAPKVYGILKERYDVIDEKWRNNGSLYMLISISAGSQEELYNDVNSLTKGEAETKLMKRK